MYAVIRGGMGNQMFQYAHGLSMSLQFGKRLRLIDATGYSRQARRWALTCFGIEPDIHGALATSMTLGLEKFGRKLSGLWSLRPLGVLFEDESEPELDLPRAPLFISGYWQGDRFFGRSESLVQDIFKFPHVPPLQTETSGKPLVAIHFRRGDYVSDAAARTKHLTCGPEWYQSAWAYMRETVPDASAKVFSDEPAVARSLLSLDGDVEYVDTPPDAPAWLDMAAMSQCSHFIISNSTYSWWAAYLSRNKGKSVIAPKWWFNGVSTQSLGLCPPDWRLL